MSRVATADTPAALTEEQRREARRWMQAARAKALRDHPYLDVALSSMLLVERVGLGTVAVDARWRLYYDPARALLHAEHLGIDHLVADWIHEVMHVLRDHPRRWDNLSAPPEDHPVFNAAGDAHVNADVQEMGLPLLPTDITFANLPPEAGCERTMTTEEIFSRLRELREGGGGRGGRRRGRRRTTGRPASGEGGEVVQQPVPTADCGPGTGGDRRPWEDELGKGDDGSIDGATATTVVQQTAEQVRDSARRGIGTIPADLIRWAQQLLDPSVDWRRELRSVVSRRIGTQAGVRDYSFTRAARRRVPGYTLPGMVGSAPPSLAAVIDTSGSMSEHDLQICLGDLLGLARTATRESPAIDVLLCDAQVSERLRIRRPGDVQSVTLRGGGGTNLVVALEELADRPKVHDVIVVMTDGGTPWPPVAPSRLAGSLVIALLTTGWLADSVPDWIRTIVVDPFDGETE